MYRPPASARAGGVSAVSGHMTRKMWDLIPVLDCSQLVKLCPSQFKLLICPIKTSGPWVDSARRTMSGKSRRCSDTRRGPPLTPKHGHNGMDYKVLRELLSKTIAN